MGEALITRRGGGGDKFAVGKGGITYNGSTYEHTIILPFKPKYFRAYFITTAKNTYYFMSVEIPDIDGSTINMMTCDGSERTGGTFSFDESTNTLTFKKVGYYFYKADTAPEWYCYA